jgi:Flp pilus assembly protein TadG
MLMRANRNKRRHAAAAVECAVVLALILVPMLLGVWEVGRVVEVSQIMDNANREGARLAASGNWTSSNAHPTMLAPSTNNDYEVQQKVLVYLQAAGVNTTGASVTVTNVTRSYTGTFTAGTTIGSTVVSPGTDPAVNANPTAIDLTSGTATIPNPDTLTITTTVPYSSASWVNNNFFNFGANLSTTITCYSVRDVPLAFSTVLPTQLIPTTVKILP